jgi:hypothetical protein
MISQLLETGYLGEDIEIHLFYSKSYYYFYQHIKDVIDLALQASFEFGKVDQSVIALQQRFMLNDGINQSLLRLISTKKIVIELAMNIKYLPARMD